MQESSDAAAAQDTHGPQLLKVIACMAARFPAAEARQLAKGMLKVCRHPPTAFGLCQHNILHKHRSKL